MIYLYSEKAQYPIVYRKGFLFQCHLGKIELPDSLEFGDIIKTSKEHEFVVLKPSISDLILNIKRKTNIMYPKDIGYIIMESTIFEGSRVLEVGTGSGGMTTVLAILVGINGKVFTFDKNEEHLENAKRNIERYGLSSRIIFNLRDVAKEGFGISDCDSCVIDLPEPWTIIPYAKVSLKKAASIAIVIPTIEQVKETFLSLRKYQFARIKCIEVLTREMYLRENITRPRERMISHTVYIITGYNT